MRWSTQEFAGSQSDLFIRSVVTKAIQSEGVKFPRPTQPYILMQHGFSYLVAVMDWHSRYVLSWRLSDSMDVDSCLEALEEASSSFGKPEIFNTDQDPQFTRREFTNALQSQDVPISMGGPGRAIDNVMIERLWRTVNYEEVYVREYATGTDCKKGLSSYFEHYGHQRRHQSLGRQTPWAVYRPQRSMRTIRSI